MSAEHRGIVHVSEPARFCGLVYPSIETQLSKRMCDFPHLRAIGDPFSTDGCRRAVFTVDDEILEGFHMIRAGGNIKLPGIDDFAAHAYFASALHSRVVVDFTVGQFALYMNTSLDKWIEQYPHLFKKRALCADKNEVKRLLGIEYPQQTIDFWEFFNSPQDLSI